MLALDARTSRICHVLPMTYAHKNVSRLRGQRKHNPLYRNDLRKDLRDSFGVLTMTRHSACVALSYMIGCYLRNCVVGDMFR